jgi:hypothetical protein
MLGGSETLEQGGHDTEEVIAMIVDFYLEQGWPLPKEQPPLIKSHLWQLAHRRE